MKGVGVLLWSSATKVLKFVISILNFFIWSSKFLAAYYNILGKIAVSAPAIENLFFD
jgi:hypothetical protein